MAQDFAEYMAALRARAAETEAAREYRPRQQAEVEKHPSYHQRRAEAEGSSNWSGGVWGGRVDRSR